MLLIARTAGFCFFVFFLIAADPEICAKMFYQSEIFLQRCRREPFFSSRFGCWFFTTSDQGLKFCQSAHNQHFLYVLCIIQHKNRSELVESESPLKVFPLFSSPSLTTAFFISNFYLYTSISLYLRWFLFQTFILYIDISVEALAAVKKL